MGQLSIKDAVNNLQSRWMTDGAPENDVVVSSRIRVARNLAHLPFPHLLDEEKAAQVIERIKEVISSERMINEVGAVELSRMNELSAAERQMLVEKHLVSPDLIQKFDRTAVVLSKDEVVSVMVNEEDHLRVQCLLPGFQLEEAWKIANAVDDALEATLDYAYSEKLGYITACPTNVGTGLRASIMLHLPCLVMLKQINGVLVSLSKLGLTVRGLYGEGTEASGNLFQVSNQITLGQTEEEIIQNLMAVTMQLVAQERAARELLLQERKENLEDKVCRAYGVLNHARIITAEETMQLLSDVRLGVSVGIIKEPAVSMLNELMMMSRPAYLLMVSGKELTPFQRDVLRATLIREKLKKESLRGEHNV